MIGTAMILTAVFWTAIIWTAMICTAVTGTALDGTAVTKREEVLGTASKAANAREAFSCFALSASSKIIMCFVSSAGRRDKHGGKMWFVVDVDLLYEATKRHLNNS